MSIIGEEEDDDDDGAETLSPETPTDDVVPLPLALPLATSDARFAWLSFSLLALFSSHLALALTWH